MMERAVLEWDEMEGGVVAKHRGQWRSENGMPPPKRVQIVDDTLKADAACRLANEGVGLLWRGDYQNARLLLQAMARRADRKPRKKGETPAEAFNLHRQAQAQRARTLGMLLIPLTRDYRIPLRRGQDVAQACLEAYGVAAEDSVVSLREVLGLVGAHEWRKKGVPITVLDDRIHPHYGVFSPLRGEYLDLIARAPLPKALDRDSVAFDIGTGTGVIAALLAKRGVQRVMGTDQDERALCCARENLQQLGYARQAEVVKADLFPEGKAALIVCNPPWVPARPTSSVEYAVYDPDSQMLRGFLNGLAAHLEQDGEGWLILSDFAEHLGLRSRAELLGMIETAGLEVLGKLDIRPRHPKASDPTDPLYQARAAEVTSLWRLGVG